MLAIILTVVFICGFAFYLMLTSTPDHSKWWNEKGRKEFMEDLYGKHD
jgi:hypothetical protein